MMGAYSTIYTDEEIQVRQISSKIVIDASADAIWQVISDFGLAGAYLPGVVARTVAGEGIGALRTLTSTDGSTSVERLAALDATALRLSYALLTDTPFADCLTTMALRDLGPYSNASNAACRAADAAAIVVAPVDVAPLRSCA